MLDIKQNAINATGVGGQEQLSIVDLDAELQS